MRYVCELCGYVYDEAQGDAKMRIAPGTAFAALPEDYECSGCGYKKEAFSPLLPKQQHGPITAQSNGSRGFRR